MLPTQSPYGLRLAEVLPTCLSAIGVGQHPQRFGTASIAVVIVVDGLGFANLKRRSGYGRFLWGSRHERIETVAPSTTGAALTTLTTGTLPGQHGLIGYRIREPKSDRLVTTLSEWDGIDPVREWQRSATAFEAAAQAGVASAVIGRQKHAATGLTAAILTGAEYVPADSLAERFSAAESVVQRGQHKLVYVYVDELDREAHASGWESDAWAQKLELLDGEVRRFVAGLPGSVGVVLTADHGIIDVPQSQHLLYDEDPSLMEGIAEVGGEPRFRYLYLDASGDADAVAATWQAAFGQKVLAVTRDAAVASGLFGEVTEDVLPRMGDVIVVAQNEVALYSAGESDRVSRGMVGQHGGLSKQELGVPLIRFGAFA
ncbi:alkaline phosphatase family protein [Lysinibacter cavernae]|uniref:Heme-degrading monooxygenase HmoA n=1 Tax=Lysinibacter cavernae TaxID=1640652 RepID=A0A7X5TSP6_9MICO|nr:alkaline phosphatase family protein [Lysinibacter cavernae]NIH52659.1 heme-degrading monooxygenase HmoA [Lysinibacter cavernae]